MGFQMSDADIDFNDTILFKDKEVVKLQIKDIRENMTNGNITLKCDVLSGEHQGKETEIFVTNKDNPQSKKRKAQFAHCFMTSGVWTRQDLIAGRASMAAIRGHIVTARSSCREHQGKHYQNWDELTDEGLGPTLHQASASQPSQPGAPMGSQVNF